jgi:hypothetical protein
VAASLLFPIALLRNVRQQRSKVHSTAGGNMFVRQRKIQAKKFLTLVLLGEKSCLKQLEVVFIGIVSRLR